MGDIREEDISKDIEKLIDILKKKLRSLKEGGQGERWNQIYKDIRKIHEADQAQRKQLNFGDYWLNAVSVGFFRRFEELGVQWSSEVELYNSVRAIVIKADNNLKLINVSLLNNVKLTCGRHEDGACVVGPLGPRSVIDKDIPHPGPSVLPLSTCVARCFSGKPIPIQLLELTELQRIIPVKNYFKGRWWKLGHTLPPSKLEWRAGYAVLKTWNKNGYHIDLTASKGTCAWVGLAASQKVLWENCDEKVINEFCILEGGQMQVYVDLPKADPGGVNETPQNW